MALPLVSLKAVGEALVPRSAGIGSTFGSKAASDLSFGSALKKRLDQPAALQSGALAQIAGLLHAGTPPATIINSVAKAVSTALYNAVGSDGSANGQSTLERALAGALAPPGTSPPNESGLQQAASLEHRLADILTKVSRELRDAGQQNRFSGQVLDANSAREIPAPQQTIDTTGAQTQTPADALAFAQSILQSVAAQLGGGSAQQIAAQSATGANGSQNASTITVHSDDVLGRMLARAANANAARGSQTAAPAPSASAQPGETSSQIFARLLNVIAESAKDQQSSGGGKQSSQSGYGKSSASAPNALQPSAGIGAPAFGASVGNAQSIAATSAPASPAPIVDPQAIIEQVVSGLILRKSGATSELRMHLQPEHLGEVSLKLTVSGNSISANLIAQNPHVRDVLLANQQQLARSLADVGLSLGNFSVDVSGGNAGFTQQQHAQQKSALAKTAALHGIADEDDSWTDSSLGPPVLPASASLVLNYLA